MEIVTNHHWHYFKGAHEVPASIVEEYRDDSGGFLKYRGTWYSLRDFSVIGGPVPGGWDGIYHDSYFSGIVIKISQDCYSYQIGRYYS